MKKTANLLKKGLTPETPIKRALPRHDMLAARWSARHAADPRTRANKSAAAKKPLFHAGFLYFEKIFGVRADACTKCCSPSPQTQADAGRTGVDKRKKALRGNQARKARGPRHSLSSPRISGRRFGPATADATSLARGRLLRRRPRPRWQEHANSKTGETARRVSPISTSRPSKIELASEQFVDDLRVRLAGGRFHHLADEPADQHRLRLRLRDLLGVSGDDVVDHLLDRRQVGDLPHSSRLDDHARVAALIPDDLEHLLGDLAGDRALAHQIEQRAKLRNRDRRRNDIPALLVEPAEQLVDHPVRRGLGVAPVADRLEEVGGLAFRDQHVGIIGREPIVPDQARSLLVGKLRQTGRELVDFIARELERQQIRIGEVTIIVRLLLGAHRTRLASGRIKQTGLLLDRAAVLDDVDLAARLVFDGLADEADGIDVLDLAARAERGTGPAYRDIDVGAQVALLHVAVAGAEIAQDRTQLRDKGLRLLGRAQIRLGYDLHQRDAG